MTNTNETIADIIAEMCDYSNACNDGYHTDYGVVRTDMRNFADRLEAAWKREKTTTEKSSAVGDAAKLREVVKELLDAMYDMGIDGETVSIAAKSPNCHMHSVELLSVIKKAKAALAAPPKNCDVGTADEQTERFLSFARLYFQSEMVRLAMNWAQMPYEEGGAK